VGERDEGMYNIKKEGEHDHCAITVQVFHAVHVRAADGYIHKVW